jgi:hypothetical protein
VENLDVFYRVLIGVAAGLITLAGAGKVVFGWLAPWKDVKKTIVSHEQRLLRDHERLQAEESATCLVLETLLALVHHSIHGNGIENLRAVEARITGFLIQHR